MELPSSRAAPSAPVPGTILSGRNHPPNLPPKIARRRHAGRRHSSSSQPVCDRGLHPVTFFKWGTSRSVHDGGRRMLGAIYTGPVIPISSIEPMVFVGSRRPPARREDGAAAAPYALRADHRPFAPGGKSTAPWMAYRSAGAPPVLWQPAPRRDMVAIVRPPTSCPSAPRRLSVR